MSPSIMFTVVTTKGDKVRDQVKTVVGGDALRMELHAVDRQGRMPQSHDRAIGRHAIDAEFVRATRYDETMVACDRHGGG